MGRTDGESCVDSPSEGDRGFLSVAVVLFHMGERACYLAICPNCDLQVSIADDTCPECGAAIDTNG